MKTELTEQAQSLSMQTLGIVQEWLDDRYYYLRDTEPSPVPHESCDGYIALNDGGAEIAALFPYRGITEEEYLPVSFQQEADRLVEMCRQDIVSGCYDGEEDDYLDDSFAYINVKVFLDGSTMTVQVYYCFDEYNRQRISWLSQMGGNPDQTLGRYETQVSIDSFDPQAQAQLIISELERLEGMERPRPETATVH